MKKITLFTILLTLSMTTFSKPTIGPPSINLRSSLANIAIVKLHKINTDNYLHFKKIKDIHNKADELIVIKSSKVIADALELNKKYIISYSAFQSTRKPVKVSPRKGGAVLINISGASPAIFSYSKDLETILSWNMGETLKSPKEILPIILRNIDHLDKQLQDFFITELVTRTNIYKHLKQLDYDNIVQTLESSSTSSTAKHLILSYSNLLSNHLSSPRLGKIIIDILNNSDTQLGLYSLKPALIRMSLVKVREYTHDITPQDLIRWLYSNNTGIIEETLDSLRIVTGSTYIDDLENVLNNTLLNKKNRTIIKQYIKRMKRGK